MKTHVGSQVQHSSRLVGTVPLFILEGRRRGRSMRERQVQCEQTISRQKIVRLNKCDPPSVSCHATTNNLFTYRYEEPTSGDHCQGIAGETFRILRQCGGASFEEPPHRTQLHSTSIRIRMVVCGHSHDIQSCFQMKGGLFRRRCFSHRTEFFYGRRTGSEKIPRVALETRLKSIRQDCVAKLMNKFVVRHLANVGSS